MISSPIWVPAGCFGIAWQLFGFKQEIVTKEYLNTKLDNALKPLYIMHALTILLIAKGAFVASPALPSPSPPR